MLSNPMADTEAFKAAWAHVLLWAEPQSMDWGPQEWEDPKHPGRTQVAFIAQEPTLCWRETLGRPGESTEFPTEILVGFQSFPDTTSLSEDYALNVLDNPFMLFPVWALLDPFDPTVIWHPLPLPWRFVMAVPGAGMDRARHRLRLTGDNNSAIVDPLTPLSQE